MGLNVGIEAHSGEKILTIHETEETREHQEYEWIKGENVSFNEAAKYRWNKVVFLFDNEKDLASVKEMIAGENVVSAFSDTSAVIAGRKRNYYEQFPIGVSKASELDKLKNMLKIERGCYFAMGDYYNDLEMIKKAKEILAAMDAELVSKGKIPQVTYIFRAKNFFGMQDQQELVLTPNNKRGDEVNEQEIVDKYKKSLPKASD